MKTFKACLVLAASAAVLVAAVPASAGGLTSAPGPIGDSIDWAANFSGTFPLPQNISTVGGNQLTVSSAGNIAQRLDQGSGWAGNFAPGTQLLWTTVNGGPDITLSFLSPEQAVGAQIQADYYGAFTAQVTVNGTHTFTENGVSNANADGSAIFIGWQGGPINTISFSLVSAYLNPNDFAIGPVDIFFQSAPGPVPGAGLAGLAALALAGLYARTRRA